MATRYGHLFPASSLARHSFAAVAAAIADLDAQELTRLAASASVLVERKTIARGALLARAGARKAKRQPALPLPFTATLPSIGNPRALRISARCRAT